MKRVHIVGCPRSGTTLMFELIATCFANDGYCEHEKSIFEDPEGAPELFFSKQPSDIKYLEKIFKLDPNLYVICMIRDPRSVLTSIHRSRPDRYFCNFRVWHSCEQAAKRLFNHPRFFRVRYEDLVEHPNDVQQQIMIRFPFLTKKFAFSEYEQVVRPSEKAINALGGLRPLSMDRVKGWKGHLPRIKSELSRHPELVKVLIEYGYERDDSWLETLDNVNVEDYPCRYPRSEQLLKTLENKIRIWRKTRRYIARHQLNRHKG